ncbi:hypothetical protein, partial [Aquitalea magnusonii]|uniref:hypothetical protein n=1 Tax=Aquitalea magnusonii TaxID=332411 RepID=UPI0019574728
LGRSLLRFLAMLPMAVPGWCWAWAMCSFQSSGQSAGAQPAALSGHVADGGAGLVLGLGYVFFSIIRP